LRAPWPADLDLSAAPSLVRELAVKGLWLEQERAAVDPRIPDELERHLHADSMPKGENSEER
jgi:hypothetical protein